VKRYQFVWWGWRDMSFRFGRFGKPFSSVYRWALVLGPLEIRRLAK
jgi:hypothetical protein